jgi:molybdate transport system ATP-binding protein
VTQAGAADAPIRVALDWPRGAFRLRADLALPGAGITVLFGPSGSGKTTLLRAVAGLERVPGARIALGDAVWQDDARGVFVPTWQRPLGYVFQEASLFDHLSVAGNLRYGLRRVKAPGGEAALEQAIELLGIGHLLARRPAALSGGERQRVAIARALATRPRLLLLDEPLAALDHARRQDILPWLERLRDELRLPMLYVTHSADELARLASHLVVLGDGAVRASGPVAEVLASVQAPVVVGEDAGVLLHGALAGRDPRWHLARVAVGEHTVWLRDPGPAVPLGRAVRLRVLARDVSLARQRPLDSSIQNSLPAVVEAVGDDAHPAQALVRLRLQTPRQEVPGHDAAGPALLARVTRRALHQLEIGPGAAVWAQVKSVALVP